MQLCRKCGTRLEVVEDGQQYHPLCTPIHEKLPGTPMSIFEMEVREDLIEVIEWTNFDSPRSKQVVLGCSEAGDPCDRKVAMRMAGVKAVNFPDPLKANMGTAFHEWLDNGMFKFQQAHDLTRWLTETEVWAAPYLKGHVDLYDTKLRLVIDWKTTSAENIKAWRKDGIPICYLIQIMLYGKGMKVAGHDVDRVGLAGINRSGTLKDLLILTVPYDEKIVQDALSRVKKIGRFLLDRDVEANPSVFAEVPAEPSRMCGYCPFYRGGTKTADDTGCPGRTTGDAFADYFQ